MINYLSALDATFAALADPTRRAILARLALGETSVSDLARPFAMSLPAVLKHVERLERAGFVRARKDGRVHRCRLDAAPMKEALEWIARYRRFWEERFDALDRYLKETQQKEEPTWQARKPAPRSHSRSHGPSRPRGKRSFVPGPKRKR
ncbi:MAG TPA: metalloregulator ArsR/SmtB family transcription factor [Thermoanaerobaculia bacterium]|nr:metalloregulator ArsR/SmtB family transcription factor [Thermoanaerobaculia bacterium]